MAGLRDLGNIWTTFKEIDIRPIAKEAETHVLLAFVGAKGVGKTTLIDSLRHDSRGNERVVTPAIEADISSASQADAADLIILVLDSTRTGFEQEIDQFLQWARLGKKLLVFYNKIDLVRDANPAISTGTWGNTRIAFGSANDPDSLRTELIPRILEELPDRHLSLARHYPLFRYPVSRELINDTSVANATYSLGTGLAEIIPLLDIPFNVADMMVLTKNQALMVYKLGLALGLPTRWQEHATQLGGVVGAGFMWRQIARQLIGLIPVWGIVPKVAVAYAGTYAVGEAIMYWYRTGHKLSSRGTRQLYQEAFANGKRVARSLLERAPRPSLRRSPLAALPVPRAARVCPFCGRENPSDATYCAYCGKPQTRPE